MTIIIAEFLAYYFIVYGSNILKFNSEHVEHVENDIIENRTDICESALAQRRSAQLPKLKKISNKPRPLSNDFSVLVFLCHLFYKIFILAWNLKILTNLCCFSITDTAVHFVTFCITTNVSFQIQSPYWSIRMLVCGFVLNINNSL